MQSLLVKIASFAVMVHMTFGCSMHHGLGNNACAHQHETACEHEGDSSHHDEDHDHDDHHQHDDQPLDSKLVGDVDETSHGSHAGCCDDGCNVTQSVPFVFKSLDFSVPYLGGVDTLALIERQTLGVYNGEPVADDAFPRGSVRAHLLLGVQIL